MDGAAHRGTGRPQERAQSVVVCRLVCDRRGRRIARRQMESRFSRRDRAQVVRHLEGHLRALPEEDQKSRAIVEQMKDDEARHATTALEHGAAELPRRCKSRDAAVVEGDDGNGVLDLRISRQGRQAPSRVKAGNGASDYPASSEVSVLGFICTWFSWRSWRPWRLILRFPDLEVVGDRGGLAEHDRRRAVFFRGQMDRALDLLRFQRLAGDDEMEVDLGEDLRVFRRAFGSRSRPRSR